MKRIVLAAALALSGLAGLGSQAQATPVDPIRGLLPTPLQEIQYYVYRGRRYCFHPDGWQGPGYYWCGYAWRHGLGWGGPMGWRGWGPRVRPPKVYRPAPGPRRGHGHRGHRR